MRFSTAKVVLVTLFLFSTVAHAAEGSKPRYLISLQAAAPEAACVRLHSLIESARQHPVESACVSLSDFAKAEPRIQEARESGHFVHHISLVSEGSREVLSIENWSRVDDTDFTRVAWHVDRAGGEEKADVGVQKMLRQFFEFEAEKENLRKFAFLVALQSESDRLTMNARGEILDRQQPGKRLAVDEAYGIFINERPRNKHFLRAVIEIGAVLGAKATVYFKTAALQDNDYATFWEGLKMHFTSWEPFKFDDNPIWINHLGHASGGVADFNFARSSGLSFMESFLMGFASSMFWEYIIEARETVSVNDVVLTPLAGAAIGEVMYQYMEFFLSSQGTLFNKVMGSIFAGPQLVNLWIDKRKRTPSRNLDEYGFNADVWHQFRIFGGAAGMDVTTPDGRANGSAIGASSGMIEIGMDSELITIPGYGENGKEKKLIGNPAAFDMIIRSSGMPGEWSEILFYVKAALGGWYSKDIHEKEGGRHGHSFFIGPAMIYEYNTRGEGYVADEIATVSVLGSTMDLMLYRGDSRVRMKIDLFADFASVRSIALEDYAAARGGIEGMKSTLKHNYYHAGGGGLFSSLEVARGRFRVGGELEAHHYFSIEGIDRFQKELAHDVRLKDDRFRGKAWVSFTTGKCWETSLGIEKRYWKSTIDESFVRSAEGFSAYSRLTFIL